EHQRLQMRVNVPHGAAGTEPAGISCGAGKLHAAEVVFADRLIEPVLQHLLDELMWHQHSASTPWHFWQRSLSLYAVDTTVTRIWPRPRRVSTNVQSDQVGR